MKKVANMQGRMKWVERVSYLLDESFRVPGTSFRFGFDPIFNLIPGAGSFAGLLISSALVFTMGKYGVSRKVVILMALNILIDAAVGSIPVVGQVFDFFYRANSRNIRLLKEHYVEGRHQGSGKGILLLFLVLLMLVMFLVLLILWKIITFLFNSF